MTESTPQKRIGPRMVPLDDLVAHPLNSNVMPEDLQEKLRAHIKRTGRYPHVIVRPHPDDPAKYQVLDGHHRLAILKASATPRSAAMCGTWTTGRRSCSSPP